MYREKVLCSILMWTQSPWTGSPIRPMTQSVKQQSPNQLPSTSILQKERRMKRASLWISTTPATWKATSKTRPWQGTHCSIKKFSREQTLVKEKPWPNQWLGRASRTWCSWRDFVLRYRNHNCNDFSSNKLNLNKLSDAELERHKAAMDKDY